MDPATIIGVVSAAISFVQFTNSVISTAYNIYDAGSPSSYKSLEDVAQSMNELSSELISQTPAQPSKGDIAIKSLAQQCQDLSAGIINRLKKTKVEGKANIRKVMKATVETICSKNEIVKLQENLRSCMDQLQFQYLVAQR
jgi:hypothetical protein